MIGWPGVWPPGDIEDVVLRAASVRPGGASVDADLSEALGDFPVRRERIDRALNHDREAVAAGVAALDSGATNVWLWLDGLVQTRRYLEPLRPFHTRERRILGLVLELLDEHVSALIDAAPSDPLIVLVSPYGMAPPDVWERWRRLIGADDSWRTSPESCPDGILAMAGRGVRPGHRFPVAAIADVAPTMGYLLGLPLSQSMDGRVVLDALDPDWLATHPLQVID